MRYNNYHKHDHLSNIFTPDCNVKAEDYIKKSLEYGHINYFTTNHGSFGDIFEARTLCDKYGIRCIAGIEAYIVPNPLEKDKRNYHIIIIPTSDAARKKVNYISSRANIDGYYYKPRIFIDDLLKLNKDDVIITTACVAGLLRDEDSINNIFIPLYQHFGKNVLLEVQNHNDNLQIEINNKALYYANKYGLKLIAANDSHYIDLQGRDERKELLKGKHIEYKDEDTFILDFPDYDIMFNRFKTQGVLSDVQIIDAINNTLIFDNCEEIKLDHSIKMPTIYPELSPSDRIKLLKKNISKKFKTICKEENIADEEYGKYKDGIRYEMKIIEDTNDEIHTADYFLFNEKNVELAVNKYGGVLTRGGRGSCASFYINKILGMTQLDRFKINLPIFPDRFASTARLLENRSLPDIDFNIEAQEPFVKASRELLGENGCYPMYAPGTMQLSEAFRNVCRSKELDYNKFNEVAKNIENYLDDPCWKEIIDEANKYVGTIISGSVHPCAHLLSNENILYEYGVTRLGENLCVLITSLEADEYKVLKNDYLIVKVWKLIHETFESIGQDIIPAKKLLDNIKNDDRVWDLFKNGITCTLNQVDSDNGTKQAQQFGIKSFEEGAWLAAAIRPSFDSWRSKFLNHEEYSTGSKDLDKVLEMTGHYILYQENLMQYFEWLGISPSESIGLIKKISKKKIKPDDFTKLEQRIKTKWIENTGSEEMFEETWDMIQSCIAYGFAAPHAAATSLDMCYGAYLKVNYPIEYYTVCFNNYSDDEIRTVKLKNELDYFGIKLSDPKFGYSHSKYSYDKDKKMIYKGLQSIKYLNSSIADELLELSTHNYSTFYDLLKDIADTSTDSRQLDILIKLDFFSDFGTPNELLKITEMYNAKPKSTINLEKTPIPRFLIDKYCKKITAKQAKDFDADELIKAWINITAMPETTIKDRLKYQSEHLGYIQYTDKSYKPDVYYVVSIESNWVSLHCLHDAHQLKIKFRKNGLYKSYPFKENDIIMVKEIKAEPRFIKLADGSWVRDEEHLEDILQKWVIST